MFGVNPLFGLSVEADRISSNQKAHQVYIVWGQIHNHPHIPDTSRERPCTSTEDLKNSPQLTSQQLLLERLNGGVEADNMSHHQLTTNTLRFCDQTLSLFHRGRDWFFHQ